MQLILRSSHPDVFLRKGFLKICSKLLNSFIAIALRHVWSPVILLRISRTLFLKTSLDGCLWRFNLKKSMALDLKKIFDYLTEIGLTLGYIGHGIEKYSNYHIALGLILGYTGVGLEQWSEYSSGVRLILWCIGFRSKNYSGYLTGIGVILLYIGLKLIAWINQAEMALEK